MRSAACMTLVLALAAAGARAQTGEDDLKVVKKATGRAQVRASASTETPPAPSGPAREGGPKWLRLRVTEKGDKRAKVSINVPLALVEALEDDWPAAWPRCEAKRSGHLCRLQDALGRLEPGQSLVEIEDEEASVRVWVD